MHRPLAFRAPQRRGFAQPVRLILAALALAALGAPGRAQPRDLSELSLEQLLGIQLDQLSITDIHHTHDAGDWMLGVKTMFMHMDGNRDGTSDRSTGDVFNQGYAISPTSMDVQSYMIHLMGAPTDDLTLFLMMPFLRKSMEHLVDPSLPSPAAGTRFTTRAAGPGDLKLTALYSLVRTDRQRLIAEAGVSFPSGSIDEKDLTPMSMGQKVRLPYPMQLGSGTYDLLPGLSYIGQAERWQWGLHASGVIRLGENDNDYRLGHTWKISGWGARQLASWLSGSLRLEGLGWGNVSGADPALNPAMVPTADPDLRAGKRLDLLLGLNVFGSEGWLDGQRLIVEGGLPVYESLTGPQLSTAWRLTAAWEWTFNAPLAPWD